ncbi:MAG: hypothetical protein ACI9WU_001886, partial [Myxococcota bacterium]
MSTPSFLQGKAFKTERSAFKINEDRAFAKLRSHRVAEPEAYVVELLLAASAGGARSFFVDAGAWTTTVRFDGCAYTREQLGSLYNHLLESSEGNTTEGKSTEGKSTRALPHLASGMLMLSLLDARSVRLRTGRVALTETWSDDGTPTRSLAACEAVAGCEITIAKKRRFALFQALGFAPTDEEAQLKQRALYSALDIVIDGEPHKPEPPPLFVSREVAEGGVQGRLGLLRNYGHAAPLLICYRGVLVERRTYRGVGGVLSSDALRRNISLNAPLEDAAYKALLMHARRLRPILEADLATQLVAESAGPERAAEIPSVQRAFVTLRKRTSFPADHQAHTLLGGLPFFETTTGAYCSWAQLAAEGEERLFVDGLPARTGAQPIRIRGHTVIALPSGRGDRAALRNYIFRNFTDVTAEVRRARHEADFMARRPVAAVIKSTADIVVSVDQPGVKGQIGIQLSSRRPGAIRFLYQGRPIAGGKKGLMPGVFGVIDCAEVEPTADFSQLKRNAALRAVQAHMWSAQDTLIARL